MVEAVATRMNGSPLGKWVAIVVILVLGPNGRPA